MKQYIDKDALVAEIERRIKETKEKWELPNHLVTATGQGILMGYNNILSLLETLEVKEVNLEKDVDAILETNDWNYDKIDFYEFAKHFFELGLKAQKGE